MIVECGILTSATMRYPATVIQARDSDTRHAVRPMTIPGWRRLRVRKCRPESSRHYPTRPGYGRLDKEHGSMGRRVIRRPDTASPSPRAPSGGSTGRRTAARSIDRAGRRTVSRKQPAPACICPSCEFRNILSSEIHYILVICRHVNYCVKTGFRGETMNPESEN